MKPRDRILKTLEHREPDKIPFDFGTTKVTGITKNAYINLVNFLGKKTKEVEFFDVTQQLAVVDESILEHLEVDTRGLMPNVVRKNPTIEDHKDFMTFSDEWGMTWKMPKEKGFYFDLVESPLSGDITEEDIDNFPWTDPTASYLFDGLREQAQKFYEDGYAIILESICAGIFEMSCRIRGYEQFYYDLALNPELACKLLDQFVQMKIEFYEAAKEEVGDYIQFIREGDDVAGQESLLISPDMYLKYIKPRHKKLFDAQREIFSTVRSTSQAKRSVPFYIFFHSDGAIYDLIPHFIEIGVDILNPVQLDARGMDAKKLKEEFGSDITFWGAGVNMKETLSKAEPEEVRQEVKENIKVFSPGGGFIFNTVHNIQDDMPPENIMAMWETLQELRNY